MKERIPKSKTKQKNLPQTMFCKNFPYSSNSCSNFRKHMINVHEKRRDYKCNICGRNFGQKVNLKTHVDRHFVYKSIFDDQNKVDELRIIK